MKDSKRRAEANLSCGSQDGSRLKEAAELGGVNQHLHLLSSAQSTGLGSGVSWKAAEILGANVRS